MEVISLGRQVVIKVEWFEVVLPMEAIIVLGSIAVAQQEVRIIA